MPLSANVGTMKFGGREVNPEELYSSGICCLLFLTIYFGATAGIIRPSGGINNFAINPALECQSRNRNNWQAWVLLAPFLTPSMTSDIIFCRFGSFAVVPLSCNIGSAGASSSALSLRNSPFRVHVTNFGYCEMLCRLEDLPSFSFYGF